MPPDSSTAMSSCRTIDASSGAFDAAAEGGVEVDQVNPLRPGSLPGEGGVQRVAVAGLGARGALDQPDGLAAGHVDGGQQGQGAGFRACHRISSSQFASSGRAGVRRLLRVELGRAERAVLDRRDEILPVRGQGEQRRRRPAARQ